MVYTLFGSYDEKRGMIFTLIHNMGSGEWYMKEEKMLMMGGILKV